VNILRSLAAVLLLAAAASSASAADKNYTRGSVWLVSMIQVEPGKGDDYIDSLKQEYTTVYEEAIKQKVILSYKILEGDAANPNDWDVMIETEVANFAAIDGLEAKFDAIAEKILGSQAKADETDKQAMAARAAIRKIFGEKVMQEIHYTK